MRDSRSGHGEIQDAGDTSERIQLLLPQGDQRIYRRGGAGWESADDQRSSKQHCNAHKHNERVKRTSAE